MIARALAQAWEHAVQAALSPPQGVAVAAADSWKERAQRGRATEVGEEGVAVAGEQAGGARHSACVWRAHGERREAGEV